MYARASGVSGANGGGAGRGKRIDRGVGGYIAPRVPATREAPVTATIVVQALDRTDGDFPVVDKSRALLTALLKVLRAINATHIVPEEEEEINDWVAVSGYSEAGADVLSIMSQFLPALNLPDGAIFLITDELPSPANFLLHRILSVYLKRPRQPEHINKTRVIILSVSEDLGRWKALASKAVTYPLSLHRLQSFLITSQNINLQNHLDSEFVLYVDLLAQFKAHQDILHGENGLRMAFERVRDHLPSDPENSNPTLLVLDDVSTLEWLGLPSSEVQRFVRALRALCLKVFHFHSSDGAQIEWKFRPKRRFYFVTT